MSDLLEKQPHCAREQAPCSAIRAVLEPAEKDLGGFSVRRLMPSAELSAVGPFVFFDHLGPAEFAPGKGIDVRPHPHIGLATVTYLFEGEILHRDSLGVVQAIKPGEVNWMTAGRGVVHSERTPPDVRAAGHTLHALQLWVALPEDFEQTDPDFFHYQASDLPLIEEADCSIRVMIGEAFGVRSAVKTWSPTLYAEVDLQAGARISLPERIEERAVYVISGGITVGERPIAAHTMVVFDATEGIELVAREQTKLVLIGGKGLGKRTVWWNLVASDRDLIERAKRDWRAGNFPPVPGETEFIPLPD